MRTSVLPSATAAARSPLMPIESTVSGAEKFDASWSRSERSAANARRATAGSSLSGAMVMRPSTRSFFRERGFEQVRGGGGRGAELARVGPGIDFKENRQHAAEPGRGLIEQLEEFFTVHALHAVEMPGGEPGLVGLQVANEFPGDGGGGQGLFFDGFLHAVFADGAQPVARGVAGGGRQVVLVTASSSTSRGSRIAARQARSNLRADGVGAPKYTSWSIRTA